MTPSCPYCRAPFETGDDLTTCSGCGTAHHTDCLTENGGCTVFGCSQAPVEEAKISVSTIDVNSQPATSGYPIFYPPQQYMQPPQPIQPQPTQQIAAPHSFLNLQMPTALEPAPTPTEVSGIAPPPPPRPDQSAGPDLASVSTAPPPPLPGTTHVGGYSHYPQYAPPGYPPQAPYASSYPTFAGYAPAAQAPYYPGSYEPRKSRVVFVLLAIFLGPFGGHNFYAGYITKAVIQLCLTVLTCFIGSAVSWIWAIVEACIIDHDQDGVTFV